MSHPLSPAGVLKTNGNKPDLIQYFSCASSAHSGPKKYLLREQLPAPALLVSKCLQVNPRCDMVWVIDETSRSKSVIQQNWDNAQMVLMCTPYILTRQIITNSHCRALSPVCFLQASRGAVALKMPTSVDPRSASRCSNSDGLRYRLPGSSIRTHTHMYVFVHITV